MRTSELWYVLLMSVAIYICYDFTSVDRDINNAMRCPLKRLSSIVIGPALIAFAFYMYIQPYSSADENKKSFIHSYDGRKHEMVELRRRYPSLNRVSSTDPPLQETNWKPAQRNDLNMVCISGGYAFVPISSIVCLICGQPLQESLFSGSWYLRKCMLR